jgi:hypothetical protein
VSGRYVDTAEIKAAVQDRALAVIEALGIPWSGNKVHVKCPYPEHGGDTDWRWDDDKGAAFCNCSKGDDIFTVVRKVRGCTFNDAKLYIAEIVAPDLIRERKGGISFKAASLLKPPPDQLWPEAYGLYVGARMGIAPDAVPVPTTGVTAWRSLSYYDPPPKGGNKPVLVGEYPAVIIRLVDKHNGLHSLRIYLAPDGRGKAELGIGPNGKPRAAKKAATVAEGDNSSGRFALFGHEAAPHWLATEGVENAAAAAYAFQKELGEGELAVAALVNAGGLERFEP